MKVLQINIFGNLSTGKIAVDIYKTLAESGHEGKIAFARGNIEDNIPYIKIGNKLDVAIHGVMTRLTGKAGFYSTRATKRLIEVIKEYNPDIIHLHNIHGYYLNIKLFFEYLKEVNKPVVWTLHDCWAFTGHCCYFDAVGCEKWRTGCCDCPQTETYPKSICDNSKWNYEQKKQLFTSLNNMTIVSVSHWLDDLVSKSFLSGYPHMTIYNGIDYEKFKPTASGFRQTHGIEDKIIVLGVASTWTERKGLEDFLELVDLLDDNFRIVLVGLNKKQIALMKPNMIGLERTKTTEELAGLYSTADVFLNAGVEETFGLTTVEAMACGTPSIVYNATALPECVSDGNGYVVEKHDIQTVARVLKSKDRYGFAVKGSIEKYDKKYAFEQYIDLYMNLAGRQIL